MKIYIVLGLNDYHEPSIRKIYNTRKKAEDFLNSKYNRRDKTWGYWLDSLGYQYKIKEYDVE